MEFYQMKCPSCGATLDIEDGIDTFYCKYCGSKVVVEGQSPDVIKAKTKIKLADKEIEKEKVRLDYRQRYLEFLPKLMKAYIYLIIAFLIAAGFVYLSLFILD